MSKFIWKISEVIERIIDPNTSLNRVSKCNLSIIGLIFLGVVMVWVIRRMIKS